MVNQLLKFLRVIIVSCFLLTGQSVLSMDKFGDKHRDGFFPRSAVVKPPYLENCTHRANNMLLTVSNGGFSGSMNQSYLDCETNRGAPSCEFPAGTQLDYLYGAGLWVGAVVGIDTLVTTGWDGWSNIHEMWPCAEPECGLARRTSNPASMYYDKDAKADFEYIALYTDTLTKSSWTGVDWDGRTHVPLNIEITETSYAWAVEYAQDFIMIDYLIRNIGNTELEDVFLGIQIDGDVSHVQRQRGAWTDDLCGFTGTTPSPRCPDYPDSINLAWIIDNDGDPLSPTEFDEQSVTGIVGVRVMRLPKDNVKVSFNWWTSNGNVSLDWGPMRQNNYRNFGTGGLGTPEGDASKYYMMSNGEQDYDQAYAAIDYSDLGWLSPSGNIGRSIANGGDARYLLSTGPFNIAPQDSLHFTIAFVGGEGLHTDPGDFDRYMGDKYMPDDFYNTLDFADVGRNAVWAGYVYDNPGFDTDNDGDAGNFTVVETVLPNGDIREDTIFCTGDGVPDFRAAAPPPPPVLRVSTELNRIILRWNGLVSESFVDPFTRLQDFEGYRVYVGRQKLLSSLAQRFTIDKLDYFRLYWDTDEEAWKNIDDYPLTLDSLRTIYGSDFDPRDYDCDGSNGLVIDTVVYCFRMADWNQSIPGWNDGYTSGFAGGIRKVYADEIISGEVTDDLDSNLTQNWVLDIDPQTGDSILYHKYYEYEYVVDGVLESVPWFCSVTAFDYGDIVNHLKPLESSPLLNTVEAWPVNDASYVLDHDLKVAVYPNPYIGDGRYAASGYEFMTGPGSIDHARRMHFANLPPSCTIRIYTLDGDLVRTIHHPGQYSGSDSNVEWNMRSTNNELVTSGIYLFVVESEWGNQIGKLVIIK